VSATGLARIALEKCISAHRGRTDAAIAASMLISMPQRTTGRNSSSQKERIRREAAQLFARNGYQATGVQALSEAVGLGRGALYHHIGSKEALLEEVCTRPVQDMIEVGEAILADPGSAEERIRRLCRAQMRTLADNQAEWTLFQRDAMVIGGLVRDRIFAKRARFEAIWRKLLEEGIERGEFRALDPIALKGILGMHNYAYLWLDPEGRLTPEEIGDTFCDVTLRGIRALDPDAPATLSAAPSAARRRA
jgi:AcrR family transcriptional regulator